MLLASSSSVPADRTKQVVTRVRDKQGRVVSEMVEMPRAAVD